MQARNHALTLVLAFTLVSCATVPSPERLSLDEKIGQMFVTHGNAVFMNERSPAYQRLERHVRELHAGGVIWFLSNVYETAMLNRKLQAAARVPLLISADLEAGMGMRLTDTTYFPPAMALAATGDPSLAEREGKAVAIEARTIGINHIYGPVADVNVDPDNPVINARSFSEDPATVATFVSAFIRGVQSERVLATAKHFPGHGDTHTDSHRSLPTVDVTRERLESVELVPFRAAIGAGVGSVMMGHLSIPALDPTPAPLRNDGVRENRYVNGVQEANTNGTLPATISRPMIEGLLRKDLGFRGLVITDAFDMGGLTEHFDAGEAAVRAVEAGEDQIVMSTDITAAIAAVKRAVASGRISESRIDESVRRILEAKSRVSHSVADPEEIFRTVDSESTRALAREFARRAITLVREESGALPLSKSARVLELVVSDFNEGANPLGEADRELRRRLTVPPRMILLDGNACEADVARVVEEARQSDLVVIALAVRARSGAGTIAAPEAARRAIEEIGRAGIRRVAISFGTPYLLREIPSVETYLCAYGPQPELQSAAVQALFGEAPIGGRLPVTIPGMYARGHGITK
jgi:beta-glucosidase-like glycosyl hydrolase